MATKKKTTPKAKRPAAKAQRAVAKAAPTNTAQTQIMPDLFLAAVFTLLCIVFAVMAYIRYAR